MSPEKAIGRPWTPAPIIFSLGVVLLSDGHGPLAFAGSSLGNDWRILEAQPDAMRLNYDIPEELDRSVTQVPGEGRERRYPSARA